MKHTSIIRTALLAVLILILAAPLGTLRADLLTSDKPIAVFLHTNQPLIGGLGLSYGDLDQLYQRRDYKPVWNTNSKKGIKGMQSLLASLKSFMAYHGIERHIFPFGELDSLLAKSGLNEGEERKAEVLMSGLLLRIAYRLRGMDINLNHLYPGWEFMPPRHDVSAGLTTAINNGTIDAYINSLAPSGTTYKQLADALKTYREIEAKGGWPPLPTGPSLKPGMNDPRVPLLRERLAAEGYDVADETGDFYSDALATMVESYQERNGLEPDGAIGGKTLSSLNAPVSQKIGQIIASMERVRQMPRDQKGRYILINSANAWGVLMDGDTILYEAPVIVGRPDRKTPFIQSAIRSVILNPSWHIPSSIARKDILPKLRKDPHYLAKMGYVIKGSVDDPHGTNVDWHSISHSDFHLRLRQPPGDMNALGKIKFDFDNDFSVYLHGTPKKSLFNKADRHLSSGCVRLQDPNILAAYILEHNEGDWTEEKIQQTIDNDRTRWIEVQQPMPVWITHQTVYFPTGNERPHFAPDKYGYDSLLLEEMAKLSRRI
ncbi:MAG: L,D-transpeptidase family protein [Alphaproteobacteria bacterium]|jgi:murein L,D-transpeptidase YcbB/YkuD|nr:L,D-transpeptidase family protein [Alphaproteobacteria bacterium]